MPSVALTAWMQSTWQNLTVSIRNAWQSASYSERITICLSVLALIIAVVGMVPGWLAWWRQRQDQKLLAKKFGSEFYSPEIIDRSVRYYIPPECSSVDPTQEAEIRYVVAAREPLFDTVDRFLAQNSPHRHLLLLADSGMGKSSFVLNYYARNQWRFRRPRFRIAVVPLGIRRALDHIKSIQNPQDTILFLDAFDEDTEAIQDHVRRLGTLMEASAAFRRVLITCRTQFFPTAEEIPTQTGVVRVGPRAAGESGGYEFRKLYLMPFDDSHVERYLRKRYRWRWITRRRARDLVNTVPLLSVRPMLLTHIPDVLASEKTVRTASELYQVVVDRWLKREDRWVDPEALRSFSERLAVNLYTNRAGRGTEHIPHTELTQLVADWELPALEDWQLRGRSLLNGDAEGNYKFAHRSIMEYLFVTQLLSANPECRGVELTDQMQFFLRELLLQRSSAAPREPLDLRAVVLCDMDLQGVNLQGADLRDADLSETDLRTANLRGANLRGANLRKVKLTVAQLEEANLQGADLTESFITNAFDMEFVWIPAGEFQMGSSDGYDNERPVHTVHIKEPFFMTKYPVTQGQWEAVMGNDPSHFKGDPQRPVENVSWHDVQAFLQALNQKEAGNAYRLPTEAEWEYACRASTTTAYSFGDDASQLGEYAWYEENSQERTHSVGQKKPNAWGLYDMHGNVWEWVQDCYHDSYTGAPIDGSAWEDDTPEYRVPVCARPPRLMH